MHILYIHQYFVPFDGAGGTRSYEMGRRLVKAGHDVTILTSSAHFPSHYEFNDPTTLLECEGMRLIIVKVPYSNKFSNRQRVRAFLDFAFRSVNLALRVRGVDVVLATSTPLTVAIPGVAAKKRLRVPLAFEVRDLWPDTPIGLGVMRNPSLIWASRFLERYAYSNSSLVIALSPGMKEGVVRTGYPSERVVVIPNTCNPEQFNVPESFGAEFLQEHPYLLRGPVISYIGTLGMANHVQYCADIAREMIAIDSNISFLIVGDGRERDNVRSTAATNGVLNRNFWMIPPVLKSDIPRILSGSTLTTSFVADNKIMWNNSANKFFDGLAAGRPIVINHEGWQANLLRERGAGLVVPASDAKAAAAMIQRFLRDEAALARARREAQRLASEEFNIDILADRLRGSLEDVVRGTGGDSTHRTRSVARLAR